MLLPALLGDVAGARHLGERVQAGGFEGVVLPTLGQPAEATEAIRAWLSVIARR